MADRYAYVEMQKATSVEGHVRYPEGWTDEDLRLVAEYYADEMFDELDMYESSQHKEQIVTPVDTGTPTGPMADPLSDHHLEQARAWKARRDAAGGPRG